MPKYVIRKAASEDDITHYALYWGNDEGAKLAGYPAIVYKRKKGRALWYTFPIDLIVPEQAVFLLVFTRNYEAEMRYGVKIPLS